MKQNEPERTRAGLKRTATMVFLTLALSLAWGFARAQDVKVTGKVVDSDTGEPIIGATVTIPNTTRGALTGVTGEYSIAAPANGKLLFQYLGYNSREVEVQGRTAIDVSLQSASTNIGEVQVIAIGYGNVRKSDFTGSVAAIGQKDINKTVVNSAEQLLQGNAAGVVVTTTTGEPGAEVSLRVRGSSSINGGSEPLIVIDNMPSDKSAFSVLNPKDIQSIEVLKDASATAIYGSRGANGVIMVTTKNGIAGKTHVQISIQNGFSEAKNLMPMMTPEQFVRYSNLSRYNGGINNTVMNDPSAAAGDNFQRLLVGRGNRQDYTVQVSGGNDKNTYFVSSGFIRENGLIKNTNLQRMNFLAKLNASLHRNITYNATVSANRSTIQKIGGGDNGAMIRSAMINPLVKIPEGAIFEDGFFIDEETGEMTYPSDVMAKTLSIQTYSKPFKLNVTQQLNWNILPSLILMVRGGYTYEDEMTYNYEPRYSQTSQANVEKNNNAQRGSSNSTRYMNENTLSYVKTFGSKHNINLLAGQTIEYKESEGFTARVYKFETDEYSFNNLGAGLLNPTVSSSSSMYSLVSFLSRAMYNYDQRYYLTATYRRDGSSRFGKDKKFGDFPSLALAWNVKNESWFRNSRFLSALKLRGTWGVTGNDGIGQNTSLTLLSDTKILLGGVANIGNKLNKMGNADIQWETTYQYNAGIDLGFFNSRLNVSVDAYVKDTRNLLYAYRLPLTTGYSSITSNIGNIRNRGLEVELSSSNIRGRHISWNTSFNIGFNDSKVTDLGGNDLVVLYTGDGMMKYDILYLEKGQPLSVFRGYKTSIYKNWKEVYDDNAVYFEDASLKTIPGMLKYQDTDGDGVITQADMTILGKSVPTATFGFTNTFTFWNFDLTVFFNGAWGNSIFNGNSGKLLQFTGNGTSGGNNQFVKALDCYRPINPLYGDPGYQDGRYPTPISADKGRAISGQNKTYAGAMSDQYIEDGSYLRLKSVSLSYRLPQWLLTRLRLQGVVIGANATNLWTLTSYAGMDPEMSSTQGSSVGRLGVDRNAYPVARTYTFNLSINF